MKKISLDELTEMIENPRPLIDQVVRDLCSVENRNKSATRRIITHLIEVRDETWQEKIKYC